MTKARIVTLIVIVIVLAVASFMGIEYINTIKFLHELLDSGVFIDVIT